MLSLIFESNDGKRYKLKELGIRVYEFEPESLEIINSIVNIPGSRSVVNYYGYGPRYINATFVINAVNMTDYALFRNEIFDIFVNEEDFYIIDEKDQTKRWHVRSDGKFSLSRALKRGTFSMSFLCVNRYQESTLTTLDDFTKTWDADAFSWNGMINWSDENLKYTFNSNTFTINNLGTAPILPEDGVLEISIIANATEYLTIENNTNGSKFTYKKSLTPSNSLVIKGVRVRNGLVNAIGDTDLTFLSLSPGENSITVNGGNVVSISFKFRFLFK